MNPIDEKGFSLLYQNSHVLRNKTDNEQWEIVLQQELSDRKISQHNQGEKNIALAIETTQSIVNDEDVSLDSAIKNSKAEQPTDTISQSNDFSHQIIEKDHQPTSLIRTTTDNIPHQRVELSAVAHGSLSQLTTRISSPLAKQAYDSKIEPKVIDNAADKALQTPKKTYFKIDNGYTIKPELTTHLRSFVSVNQTPSVSNIKPATTPSPVNTGDTQYQAQYIAMTENKEGKVTLRYRDYRLSDAQRTQLYHQLLDGFSGMSQTPEMMINGKRFTRY
ncbi:MAG: hypothetical protein AAGB12_04235 [Pseudomonadota bacterium]